jgi:myo-inositol-1(or 4)-monophosphatase
MARMSPDINVMIAAAEKASRALLRDFGEVEQLQVSKKGPTDFVSAADKRAEDILYKELSKARPEYGFIMEEAGAIKGKPNSPIFVIDPLDGTRNFLHGIPNWCISIAVIENGKTKSGIIYAPVTGEMFHAELNNGAFIGRKRILVSGRNKLNLSVVSGGTPLTSQKWSNGYADQLKLLSDNNVTLRRLGSSALELAYVAAGRLKGYWQTGLKSWDMAAAMLIITEAKGKVTSLDPTNPDPMSSGSILASNGLLHDSLEILINNASM